MGEKENNWKDETNFTKPNVTKAEVCVSHRRGSGLSVTEQDISELWDILLYR